MLLTSSSVLFAEVVQHSESSVLSVGRWVKIRTQQTGIHVLTNAALNQMGFNDLANVAIFGGSGVQLSFSNADSRADDLVQLPTMQTSNGLLFYAENTQKWSYTETTSRFECSSHQGSEYNYYFITDSRTPLSMSVSESNEVSTTQYTSYTARTHHEINSTNIGGTGRLMVGEELTANSKSLTLDMELPQRESVADEVKLTISFVVCSTVQCNYSILFNGNEEATGLVAALGSNDIGKQITRTLTINSTDLINSKLTLSVDLSGTNTAYLDYVTTTSNAVLDMSGASQLAFRQAQTYYDGSAATYMLKNTPSDVVVCDVSNGLLPSIINTSRQNGTLVLNADNGYLTEYVAFSPSASDLLVPQYVGEVENQNLHSQQPVDYIIVAHPDFMAQAERLAQLHRQYSGLTVAVASTEQIYNEFSAGKADVSAIRDYVKMVYDRDASVLRMLLLFGDGSFDNINESDGNKIPTYQSTNSLNSVQSYVTDDFFCWLDDEEGSNDLMARMDIGVGRFPCRTTSEATILVDKVETYLTNLDNGSWKNKIAFVADDQDNNEHLINAENLAQKMELKHPEMNYKRIYQEAYQLQTNSQLAYPGARADFTSAINNGSLIVNYVGHGSALYLTGDGLFRQSDITTWTNKNRLVFFITAACNFGPFDKTETSSGEEALMYENGGFIGCFSATRTVYSNSNYQINSALYDYLLETKDDGSYYTIGEAVREAKNKASGMINSLKYVLLADPALTLYRNAQTIVTDSINGEPKLTCDEPIKALKLSRIAGSVRTVSGEVDETFNGKVDIVLYDKKATTKTFGIRSDVYAYEEYKNTLYSGQVDVENGRFVAEFRLSKDIDFALGYGRVFYYATATDNREANGAENDILVGDVDSDAVVDTIGPEITAWVDFTEFADGQTTGPMPILYATISDVSGINTSGLGIGHDISVCIDNDRNNPIILNDYFSYNSGSYTTGTVRYQFSAFDNGSKSLTLKAWDTYNNSSEINIGINSQSGSKIRFGQTQLYPNPYRASDDNLWLRFSHNDGGTILETTIDLFSGSGCKLISEKMTIIATETQTEAIDIASVAPHIHYLPQGLYIVRVSISSTSGRSGCFCKRLLITK